MKIVALTGGIGSGKSTTIAFFAQLGIPTWSADTCVHTLLSTHSPTAHVVAEHFGAAVLDSHAQIDPKKLADIVFFDAKGRQWLESVIHPLVRTHLAEWIAARRGEEHPYCVVEIPLLYEKNLEDDFDVVIAVSCSTEQQLSRAMQKLHATREQIRARMEAQLPLAEKTLHADFVIDNSQSKERTLEQVRSLHQKLVTLK